MYDMLPKYSAISSFISQSPFKFGEGHVISSCQYIVSGGDMDAPEMIILELYTVKMVLHNRRTYSGLISHQVKETQNQPRIKKKKKMMC